MICDCNGWTASCTAALRRQTAYHAVATDAAMVCSWRAPDVAAAAVLLVPLACAVHPLALSINNWLSKVFNFPKAFLAAIHVCLDIGISVDAYDGRIAQAHWAVY